MNQTSTETAIDPSTAPSATIGSLVSVRKAAKALGIPYASTKRLVDEGRVPAMRLGSRLVVSPAAVQNAIVSLAAVTFSPKKKA